MRYLDPSCKQIASLQHICGIRDFKYPKQLYANHLLNVCKGKNVTIYVNAELVNAGRRKVEASSRRIEFFLAHDNLF
jgi:hypothetical protein